MRNFHFIQQKKKKKKKKNVCNKTTWSILHHQYHSSIFIDQKSALSSLAIYFQGAFVVVFGAASATFDRRFVK